MHLIMQTIDCKLKGQTYRMESPTAYKRVPSTAWIAIKTSRSNVFFYNIRSKASTWEIPAELEDFVLNAFAPPDQEQIQEKLLEKQEKGMIFETY